MKNAQIIEFPSLPGHPDNRARVMCVKSPEKWLIMQPGLGSTVETSEMVKTVAERLIGRCNILMVDHPFWGMSDVNAGRENFSLRHCMMQARNAIQHVLTRPGVESVALLGGSLGFWSLNQASREIYDPRIRLLFGKSGIASYQAILARLHGKFGSKLKEEFLKVGADGWGHIIMGDRRVNLHENFLDTIGDMRENEYPQPHPTTVVHGLHDQWTTYKEMQQHIQPIGKIFSRDCDHNIIEPDGGNIDEKIAVPISIALGLDPRGDGDFL